MAKFIKKSVVIEAVQWFPDQPHPEVQVSETEYGKRATINTLEGLMFVSPGDWIIKGIKGEFYPCKPDIFEMTYEVINERDGIVLYSNTPISGLTIARLAALLREYDKETDFVRNELNIGWAEKLAARLLPRLAAPDDKPIYIYRSPIEKRLVFPELPEPLIIGPKMSIVMYWRKNEFIS